MRSQNGLTRHLGIAHGEDLDVLQRLKCKKCSRVFRSRKLYERHVKSHAQGTDFPCHVCDKKYINIYETNSELTNIFYPTDIITQTICDAISNPYMKILTFTFAMSAGSNSKVRVLSNATVASIKGLLNRHFNVHYV